MSAPYTSELAATLADDLLRRFERYVRIDTQSARDATGSPSTPGQLDLAKVLVSELGEAGLFATAFGSRCSTRKRPCSVPRSCRNSSTREARRSRKA